MGSVVTKFEPRGATANMQVDGKTVTAPTITGSEGEKAIDIAQLRAQTGVVTFDNGFMNTASCLSAITFLDGERGILHYRGYPIDQLAEKSNFLEVSWLLLFGELPTAKELGAFTTQMHEHSKIPTGVKNLIKTFPRNAHPMGVLSAAMVALSGYYPELTKPNLDEKAKRQVFCQLLAQVPQLAAYYYRHTVGKTFVNSKKSLDYAANFLNMCFGPGQKAFSSDVARALDVLLILHADHEQNCSTSTVRLVGSSQANVFASVAAGANALWGPLHGGANQEVLEMLEEIHKSGGDFRKALARAKDKNDNFRLMGFGHRVYKNFDPRAKIIKHACDSVLRNLGIKDPLLDIAKGLESEALRDSYFVERKLYPNVDFYSGIIYRGLGIPTNMFTVMFAIGRLPGWLAQWKEMIEAPTAKIGRPRQIYTGATERPYVAMLKRRG